MCVSVLLNVYIYLSEIMTLEVKILPTRAIDFLKKKKKLYSQA